MSTSVRAALAWCGLHAVAVAMAIGFLAPLLFLLLTSVMTDQQALTSDLWPRDWQWSNFVTVFDKAPMLGYFAHSLFYSITATAAMLVSSVPVAYALAKLRWRGRTWAFYLVIVAMLLPPQVIAVPMYVMWAKLGLTGSLWPLILPNLFGDAFSIFLLRQFLVAIPQSYIDSARIDGASELGVLLRIVVPMARPGIAAAGLFMFLKTWNDYFGPLLYTGENRANWTLSLGLAAFRSTHQVQWNLTMAATVLVMLPVVVLFFFAQKSFIEGIKLSGVKG
ncbi:carbohydrate ABC transporter permease [Cryptosporangium arvum]|uniref:Carbohydrate ABC transporter membrane protein 2, CUT1 family n=1 Tax=Cryptosporangium arvum DSM 44712 TaxID=927661 RepID=A0A010Z595_9ACTN|nr:carbohydrate ABC transporter permease [Cryptosporangium arvum]EXG82518.1 carbohydrate ABC transporter membrane protein 2, CUT1 family [Cryptosporangium arvum DSM 44712]